jgi:RNA polymerase sigma-70 factor, ECF subfamily
MPTRGWSGRWRAGPWQAVAALVISESSAKRQALRDPDVRLMLEVQEGSGKAFEELVLRYQGRLVGVLEHLAGHRDLAEDLAQEVFLRVYRARGTYVPGAKFSTWLFTIANNVAASAIRTKIRRREVTLDPQQSASMSTGPFDALIQASSGQMPARQLDKAEMSDIVHLALQTLNGRQRMAVLLNKFEGMSYLDIAQTMGLSVKAIKSLLSRARLNLRDVIEPYLEQGERPGAKHQES